MTVAEPTLTQLRATNRAIADSVLVTLTGSPVRYGSPAWHALPADHPHRHQAMQRAAQAWWQYWQPEAIALRRAAEAERIDRAVAARLREISHDIAGAWTAQGLGVGPSWQELQRRRYPWRYVIQPLRVTRKEHPTMDTNDTVMGTTQPCETRPIPTPPMPAGNERHRSDEPRRGPTS